MSALAQKLERLKISDVVLLTPNQVIDYMNRVPGWQLRNNCLEREFRFRDFPEAIEFINRVARLANDADHHPNIFNSYNKVKVEVSTHKVGGLSWKDFDLAEAISGLL